MPLLHVAIFMNLIQHTMTLFMSLSKITCTVLRNEVGTSSANKFPLEKAQSGFMVADPLTLLRLLSNVRWRISSCILVADHLAHQFTDTPVWVKGSGCRFGTTLHCTIDRVSPNYVQHNRLLQRHTPLRDLLQKISIWQKFMIASPIAEVLATEDLGFAARGMGGRFAREGEGRRERRRGSPSTQVEG